MLVPLENPAATVKGKAPKFGKPILVDLDKRGMRSIDRAGDHYRIVAGLVADTGKVALYRWSGWDGEKPALIAVTVPPSMSPEAMIVLPGGAGVVLLSDDGVDYGIKCGSPGKATQKFRSLTVRNP